MPSHPKPTRVEAIDLLRGLLMALMALDHTRDYFSNVLIDPTDPLASWPALFLTRWLTHLCAPGFVALTGASVYLQRQRGKPPAQVSRLLWTRGLWLLFLDATFISFAWSFTFRYPYLNIISTIGISMVLLAPLQRASVRAVGLTGAAIVLLHNLLDPLQTTLAQRLPNLWSSSTSAAFWSSTAVPSPWSTSRSSPGSASCASATPPARCSPRHSLRRKRILWTAATLLIALAPQSATGPPPSAAKTAQTPCRGAPAKPRSALSAYPGAAPRSPC